MRRLNPESLNKVVQQLPDEVEIAQPRNVYAVESLNEDYPEDKVPLMVPEGANRAKFLTVGELVYEVLPDDADFYEFTITSWQVYTQKYKIGD